MKIRINDWSCEYDPSKILNVEAIAAQKVTGLGWAEWLDALGKGDMTALTALVWVLRKRTEPELRFTDVSFPIGDVEYEDDDEVAEVPTPPADEPDEVQPVAI